MSTETSSDTAKEQLVKKESRRNVRYEVSAEGIDHVARVRSRANFQNDFPRIGKTDKWNGVDRDSK